MKKKIIIALIALLTIGLGVYLYKKNNSNELPPKINPAFSNYISAFTSGVISSESTIQIRLVEEFKGEYIINEPIDDDLFDFSPNIKGKAYWVDSRTIEFRPEDNMPSGEIINVAFELGKLMETPSDLKIFKFQFQIIKQSFDVKFTGIEAYELTDLKRQKIIGTVTTADVVSLNIEKVLAATQNNKDLSISWTHESDRKTHRFVVENVVRSEEASEVNLKWNGDPINVDLEGEEQIEIPSLSDFKILKTTVIQQPEQYVSIIFSDPISKKQNLNGLIYLKNNTSLKFIIEGYEIKVFPAARMSGEKTLIITTGVKNILDYKLKENIEISILFEDIKPSIEFIGEGSILPSSENGLLLPFKSVNLHSVRVKIVQIFENNVGQFLQINALNGNDEIKRVGRVVFNKKIKLASEKPIDYGRWNNFSLDLSELIKTQPGAIYKVYLSFKKSESMYPCGEDAEANLEEVEEENWDENDQNEYSYWGGYEDYYYYDDYNWQERENPCSNSYYRGNKNSISKNILASDLGIIAKKGTNKEMWFAVTDLKTTAPLSGVELEIYNFQQQLIDKITTDANGMANIELKKNPFLLIAKKDKQRGYLKLDNGSSLSLSKFDVSGEIVQKGIKGFIYGERGVWRPGDSLFINFILEDKNNILPKNHPVNFELKNPQGQTIVTKTLTKSVGGFYNFSTATDEDAPTGNWTAKIKVGGATFSKTIKIETIKPNRLKINLDFNADILSKSNKNVNGTLNAKWLHGAIAKNLKATIYATLKATNTSFEKYKEHEFDDPTREFYSEEINVFQGKLNEQGNANVFADLEVNQGSPGMLKASFDIKVFEESGDFSIDRFTIPYAPYEKFVGVKLPKGDKARGMLLTDTDHKVEIVTVDANGKPVSESNIKILLYKVEWRWWWESGDDNGLSRYNGRNYYQPISEQTISTNTNGLGTGTIKINYPDWGRYLVKVCMPDGGHCTGQTTYIDWPGWAGRSQKDNPGGASMLLFALNKDEYNVGESATITFPSNANSRALVSIESGSKVIEANWVETTDKETHYSFKITKEMAPNAYVNVTLVQPHNQTANDLPIRLYGVLPLKVEDSETHINPILEMPDELAPEKPVTIKVKEENGQKMTYTIAMVDEGLLDLTRFKTPTPWNAFYAREALGVKTWDMYDDVIGAFNGELSGLLAIGGDDELNGKKGSKKANRFKPMVKVLGPFELGSNQTGEHTFTMPKYIGSVRTMIIAGNNGAYGNSDKTTPVKQPLMVLATLPRVLSPTEIVSLPVTVFAMDKKIKNVSVMVKTNDLFTIEGASNQSISFAEEGEENIFFNLKVKEKIGIGKVTVTVKSGSESASYDIELDVRNPNPRITNVIDTIIKVGETWNSDFQLAGITGTNESVLEISTIPPLNLENRLKYLIQYPHGCVEQTTSSVFPQLYLSDLMEVDERVSEKTSSNIKAGINRLKSFQTSDGGFSYWAGQANSNDWGSSYAGHFLLEAKEKGFALPSGMLENWIKYQKNVANNWNVNSYVNGYKYKRSDFVQAYRLFTLALAGSPQLGAMNRLREQGSLTNEAKWRLAAAYQLAGQSEVASDLINTAKLDVPYYSEFSYSYGSSDRDKAMILEALCIANKKEKGMDLIKQLSASLCQNRWMSTQTTAYSLLAISKYVAGSKAKKEMKYSFSQNNGEKTTINIQLPLAQSKLESIKKSNSIKVVNSGNTLLFARIITSGIPTIGEETSVENDIKMTVKYKDLDNNIIDPSNISQGTDFKAEVTIFNPGIRGDIRELALTQIFPSGWEIRNLRLSDMSSVHFKDYPTYQDIRDDRVLTYFDLRQGDSKTFVVLLNATYNGKYYLPAVNCEAMYDNTVNAREAGMWVEIKK